MPTRDPEVVLAPVALAPDDPDDVAVATVGRLALALDARVDLVHVRGAPGTLHPERLPEIEAVLREPRARLSAHAASLEALGVSVRSGILPGIPHVRIAELAAAVRPRFVAMRGRHHGVLGSLGHVTERVLRTASAPILSLPPAEAPPAFERVIVATDFSEPADRAIAEAAHLAQSLGAALELVYVAPDEADAETIGLVEAALEKRAAALHVTASPRVLRGDAAKQLLAQPADLIALGATGKGRIERVLLGSTTTALLRRARAAILMVP